MSCTASVLRAIETVFPDIEESIPVPPENVTVSAFEIACEVPESAATVQSSIVPVPPEERTEDTLTFFKADVDPSYISKKSLALSTEPE